MDNYAKKSKEIKQFIKYWSRPEYKENGGTGRFWTDLLRLFFGVTDPGYIDTEKSVPTFHGTKESIDVYIPTTKTIIEQKKPTVDLDKHEMRPSIKEFGGWVTPYMQASVYNSHLINSQQARWIITCNFHEFRIYNMEEPINKRKPTTVFLNQLNQFYYQLAPALVDPTQQDIKQENELSNDACKIISRIYHQFLSQYSAKDKKNPQILKDINRLCVRLVFCFYADDSNIFGKPDKFYNYMKDINPKLWHLALHQLFQVLNIPESQRDSQLNDDLASFPYVNGGMFAEDSKLPAFNKATVKLILKADNQFHWSKISPSIFGSMFEMTLNPKERHTNGMHYTTVQNIHKVIDPLFLNYYRRKLNDIKLNCKTTESIHEHAREFQKELASLTFFDPACGSGNFLTETYICLRKLENEAIRLQFSINGVVQMELLTDVIKVKITQFYGLEISDFAASVAKTAMWIAQSQMDKETQAIIQHPIKFLPLTTNNNIKEANALTDKNGNELDWNTIIPANKLDYIISNPPFAGDRRDNQQKQDMKMVMKHFKNIGRLDYVSCWYKKSVDMMEENHNIKVALVSTNSIVQGVQVSTLWPYVLSHHVQISFAYMPFKWGNHTATKQAQVFCIIVGLTYGKPKVKRIFDSNDKPHIVKNINPYLRDLPNIIVYRANKPLGNVPKMRYGNKPTDKGYLSKISTKDMKQTVKKYPQSKKYFKRIMGAREFIHKKERWCLWLYNTDSKWMHIKPIREAVDNVAKYRKGSKAKSTRDFKYPYRFRQIVPINSDYLLMPKTTSVNRKYIPIGFMNKNVIPTDKCFIVPNASLWLFGVLISIVHMEWMRLVSGRLGQDYEYTTKITYNSFPWAKFTDNQKRVISKTAQGILNARANHKNETLAEMYNNNAMKPDLRKAHENNDRAVLKAYGLKPKSSKKEIILKLLKMYSKLIRISD